MRNLEVKTVFGKHEETCRVCDDVETPAVVIISGGVNCGYCGNELHLCEKHLRQLQKDINKLLDK